MKHIPLAVAFACYACGHDKPNDSRRGSTLCDDLAISAEVARALRDQVAVQFASAEHAESLWKQATRDTETKKAWGQRAFAYERTGLALCTAALLVSSGMLEMATHAATLRRTDLHAAQNGISELSHCPWRATHAEWSSFARVALEMEDGLVRACYEQLGGQRPPIDLPPILLPGEPAPREVEGAR